jgi:hypothetical protein
MGLVIEGAVQQAPQRGRQEKEVLMDRARGRVIKYTWENGGRTGQTGRFPAEIPATLFPMNAGGNDVEST